MFQVAKEEQEMADKIKEKWETLFLEALEVDHSLGGMKSKFIKVIFVMNTEKKLEIERKIT